MEQELNEKEYKIPAKNMTKLEHELNKLNKRAKKLGVPCVTIVENEKTSQIHKLDNGTEVEVHYHLVTITGVTPKLDGWEFMATIEHSKDLGNILRSVPWVKNLPQRYRTAEPVCGHCKISRYRKETFLVRKNNHYKQVGRTCLKDFLGGADPQGIASNCQYLHTINELLEYCENYEGFGGRAFDSFNSETFLSQVAASIAQDGWVSRSTARDRIGVLATADKALEQLFPPKPLPFDWNRITPTDKDKTVALEAVEWAVSLSEKDLRNDFLWNCHVVSKLEYITFKQAGIAAAIVFAYLKSKDEKIGKKRESEDFSTSLHIGEIKERLTLTVQVISSFDIATEFGISILYRMKDENGNLLIWFSSSRELLDIGKDYNIKGTVKKHDTFNGCAQTVLTRVKVC